MYNWSQYISPDNIEEFKAEYGIKKYQYDIFDNNDVLMAKLQGGATGYDIASPTMNYLPAMIESGFLAEARHVADPEHRADQPDVPQAVVGPDRGYAVPKDYGTTGILYRTSLDPVGAARRGRTSTT